MAFYDFTYIRPDDLATLYAPVSGASDADHQASWLCDGRPNRPARATSGTVTWTITPSGSVDLIAVINHGLDQGRAITIGGSVSAELTAQLRADNLPVNPWVKVALTSVSSLTVSVSGNSRPVILGEVLAGRSRTLQRPVGRGGERVKEWRVVQPPVWSSVPGYDVGQDRFRFAWETDLTEGGMNELQAWEEATRHATRPSLIIPSLTVIDCYAVDFDGFSYQKMHPHWYHVRLNFIEYPRTRWP